MEERGPTAYAAEFFGTFLLVFFIASIVVVSSPDGVGATDYAVIGLVHAFVLAMLVYTLGGTSGAHFNPAVTFGLLTLRRISPFDAAVYWLVQLAGGVVAALVVKLLLLEPGRATGYGATAVSDRLLHGSAPLGLLCEVIGTFVLMWAIMGTAVNPRGERAWAGLVIGIALGLGVMTLAPLDGAGFNPARWLGPAVVSGQFADAWIYIVGPLIGALGAAQGYKALVLDPQERVARRPIDTLD
jgi:MIP family channel proteins